MRAEHPNQAAAPIANHIAALRAAGMHIPAISAATGVPHGTLYNITQARVHTVYGHTARALLALTAGEPTPPAGFRDATGTRRRVQGLATIGHSLATQRNRASIVDRTMYQLIAGHTRWISHRNADAIATMYDQLSGTPGPSKVARTWARKHGWVPPLAWDNIDDPAAVPDLGSRARRRDTTLIDLTLAGDARARDLLTGTERRAAFRAAIAAGVNEIKAARLAGLSERTVDRLAATTRSVGDAAEEVAA